MGVVELAPQPVRLGLLTALALLVVGSCRREVLAGLLELVAKVLQFRCQRALALVDGRLRVGELRVGVVELAPQPVRLCLLTSLALLEVGLCRREALAGLLELVAKVLQLRCQRVRALVVDVCRGEGGPSLLQVGARCFEVALAIVDGRPGVGEQRVGVVELASELIRLCPLTVLALLGGHVRRGERVADLFELAVELVERALVLLG